MAAAIAASSIFGDNESQMVSCSVSCSVPSCEASHRGGFTGMFKVPSLVFDIELEDNGIGGHWQEEDWEEDEVVTEIQRFVQPTTQGQARLLSDVKVACPHAKDGQDTARLVQILTALGYKCCLRTALGGGDGADCLRNLRHTFITCETPAAPGAPARRFIIDPQFKEQFIIAKTTARYASILEAIPQVFVGPEEHLSLLVNFLCTEMSAAFRQLGSVLPPWRQASSMLSKWRPRKSMDDGAGPDARNGAPGTNAAAPGGIAAAAGSVCVGVGGQGGCGAQPSSTSAAAQPWACTPLAGMLAAPPSQGQQPPPAPPQQQQVQALQHWQQTAMVQQLVAGATAAATAVSRRPSYEPQRVVFGGNFVPITPTPAPVS